MACRLYQEQQSPSDEYFKTWLCHGDFIYYAPKPEHIAHVVENLLASDMASDSIGYDVRRLRQLANTSDADWSPACVHSTEHACQCSLAPASYKAYRCVSN